MCLAPPLPCLAIRASTENSHTHTHVAQTPRPTWIVYPQQENTGSCGPRLALGVGAVDLLFLVLVVRVGLRLPDCRCTRTHGSSARAGGGGGGRRRRRRRRRRGGADASHAPGRWPPTAALGFATLTLSTRPKSSALFMLSIQSAASPRSSNWTKAKPRCFSAHTKRDEVSTQARGTNVGASAHVSRCPAPG